MRCPLLSLLLLFAVGLSGQYTLSGYVIDDATGKPVPFASIFLEEQQSYGVLTNERGEYKIRLDSTQRQDMTLMVTALSYKPFRARARVLSFSKTGKGTKNVRLETEFVSLPQVVVLSDIGLRGLMQRVIDRIPDNYGSEKYLLKAYHRSYFASDVDFARLNEAYLTIEDGRYTEDFGRKSRVWVEQYRSPETPADVPPHIGKFFGDQYTFVAPYYWQSNPLRMHSVWRYGTRDVLPRLTFRQTGEFLSGTDTLLRIQYTIDADSDYDPNKGWIGEAGYDFAEVLINKTDLAILQFRQWNKGESIHQSATYQKIDGKYYFRRGNFSWAIDSDFYVFPRLFNNFLYVTEVITDPDEMKRTKKGKRLRGGPMEELRLKYDPDYWRGEERLLQLPAEETVRLQLSEIMGIDVPRDSISRDSSK
jgi:hypothetical protein